MQVHGAAKTPSTRLQLDKNSTRVASRHNLLHSCIRQWRGLSLFAANNPKEAATWVKDADEWKVCAEFEGVLNLTKAASTLVQTEKHCVAAFRYPLLRDTMDALRAPFVPVIELDEVKNEPRLLRRKVAVDHLTGLGRECLNRAKLETERRYCGNRSEEISGDDVWMSSRDELAALLDPRTNACTHLKGDPRVDLNGMYNRLKEAYVRWGVNAHAYRKEKAGECVVRAPAPAPVRAKVAPPVSTNAWGFSRSRQEEEVQEEVIEAPLSAEEVQAQEEIELRNKLEEDFGKHFKNYVLTCEEINWKSVDGVEVPDHRPMIWKDLWKAKMGHVMKVHFLSKDEDGNKYGFLPKMAAIASRGSIGALMAASFCERINSCSNLVVTEGNSVLGPDLVEKVVMLRMNQGFTEMMRREYPQALTLKYPKLGTIVSPEDNVEDPEPSDKAPLRDCDME